jgi:hypothetical protein
VGCYGAGLVLGDGYGVVEGFIGRLYRGMARLDAKAEKAEDEEGEHG